MATHTLNNISFTDQEIENLSYGFFEKDNKTFYCGNIFDTPFDHNDNYHDYIEINGKRIFTFGSA